MLWALQREQILPLALHVNAAMNAAYAKQQGCVCVQVEWDFFFLFVHMLMRCLKLVNCASREEANSAIWVYVCAYMWVCICQGLCVHVCVTSHANCLSEDFSRPCPSSESALYLNAYAATWNALYIWIYLDYNWVYLLRVSNTCVTPPPKNVFIYIYRSILGAWGSWAVS